MAPGHFGEIHLRVLIFCDPTEESLGIAEGFSVDTLRRLLSRKHKVSYRNPRFFDPSPLTIEKCDCVYAASSAILKAYADLGAQTHRLIPISASPIGKTTSILPAHSLLSNELPPDAFANAPRVWIVGGGPSLTGFDWRLLRGEIVIAVNRSFEHFTSAMALTVDSRWLDWVRSGTLGAQVAEAWSKFSGFKIYVRRASVQTPAMAADCNLILRFPEHDRFPPNLADGFGELSNSGYAGLLLAWALGAKDINLLGFDMAGDNKGAQAWHHAPYPHTQGEEVYLRFNNDFERAAPVIKKAGIRVTNWTTPAGQLECFTRRSLDELPKHLKNKPSRPLVIGYHTGGGYELEARAMIASISAFGLEHRVEELPSLGSWQANTYRKAEYILETLRAVQCPVLFLDADARMRRYPTLFDDFNADLGLSWFDWEKINASGRKGKELSSAVMYLAPSKRAFALLEDWIACNKTRAAQRSDVWEQANLAEVLRKQGRSFKVHPIVSIPHSYNQIFDTMAHVGPPVIEQMQASRRLKQEAI